MFANLARTLFGTSNGRKIKHLNKLVERVNKLETTLTSLDDVELAAKTQEFRARASAGETLDELMPEAFAVCREASKRALGMRHFDVQLIGGAVLHSGAIAEMRDRKSVV